MSKTKVMVIGSYNVGLAVVVPRIPRPRETIMGSRFDMGPGGKGSNQAIGIRRLGGYVYYVGKIGNDIFAKGARELFLKEGLDTRFIFEESETYTGVGIISIDEKGENAIAVAPGANFCLTPTDIRQAKKIMSECRYLLIQLEIPLATVEYAVSMAKELGLTVILNPAPAQKLSKNVLSNVDILTPNEIETEILTDATVRSHEDAMSAGVKLLEEGVKGIVITCGQDGALLITRESSKHFPGYKVNVVDTTGAGDAFNAGLVYALGQGYELSQAIDFANKVAALEITKRGVIPGLPTLEEVQKAFR